MKDLKFTDAGGELTVDDIDQAEKTLGFPFPHDFRQFLLSTNGGRLTDYHVVRIEACDDDVLMHYFLEIGGDSCIVSAYKDLSDELPKGFIIFATDPGGNKFLMDLSAGEPTGIYYWDRVRHFRRSKKKANTYQIADSFTEFLEKLRLMPD
jgi:cell wall assembly regulator SMI1